MNEFVLKNHIVGEASFIENSEKEKNSIEVGVLIPKDEGRKAVVKLNFHMGKEEERRYLLLKTISVFEVIGENEISVTEEEVQKNVCRLL